MCAAPVLPVNVECVSCSVLSSPHRISHTTPIILSGQCGQCDDQAQVTILTVAVILPFHFINYPQSQEILLPIIL